MQVQTIKFTVKKAQGITGSLGEPSKMPGYSYGISAYNCKVGQRLAKVKGSVCEGCYALKANYEYPSVVIGHHKRELGLNDSQWVEAMVFQLNRKISTHVEKTTNEKQNKKQTKQDRDPHYFRWHDSGDIQSLEHLKNIVAVAERTPEIKHWLPTRELQIVMKFLAEGNSFPGNMCVRLSAPMVDAKPVSIKNTKFAAQLNTSTVHDLYEPHGEVCMAYTRDNKCGDCRACWDKSVANISYKKH